MANIQPFRAIRPSPDKVHLVASRSYITYSKKDLRSKLDENPYTFLHILNPEYKSKERTPPLSTARFTKIRDNFQAFLKQDILQEDSTAGFYVYRQIKDGHPYLGIIACASVDDYHRQIIKKHEATIAQREETFKNYLHTVKINAEPVCLSYPNHPTIDQLTKKYCRERAVYDFTTTNKVRHTLWVIESKEDIKQIHAAFAEIPSIYIADGHHRSASSALLGKELQQSNPTHSGKEGYNFFMAYLIPESNLQIFSYNRLIRGIEAINPEKLIGKIKQKFQLIPLEEDTFIPSKKHEIGMYLNRKWYCLVPKKELYQEEDTVGKLDVSILSKSVLKPIFGITDLRTDKRIYFKGGADGVLSLMEEVDQGKAQIAFAHFPLSVEDLRSIADENKIMPPKSTWIEPKLRSGLTVYDINQEHALYE